MHERLRAYLRDPDYRERRVYKIKRDNPNFDNQDVEHALASNEEKAVKRSKVALQYLERQLLSSEIIIVCIGTIFNNFGDKLIERAVRYINSL